MDAGAGPHHLVTVLGLLDPCGQAGHHGHLPAVAVAGNPFTQRRLNASPDQVQVFQVVGLYPPVPGLGLQPQTDAEVWVRGRFVPIPVQGHTSTAPFLRRPAIPADEAPWRKDVRIAQPGQLWTCHDVRDLLAAGTAHEDQREKVVLRAARVPEPMVCGDRTHQTSMRAKHRRLLRDRSQAQDWSCLRRLRSSQHDLEASVADMRLQARETKASWSSVLRSERTASRLNCWSRARAWSTT